MTFAALTLEASSGAAGGSITSVSTGVGYSVNFHVGGILFGTYTWWGWLQATSLAPNIAPSFAIGTPTPTMPTLYGNSLVGVYGGDLGVGDTNARAYYVVVAGIAPTGTVSTLTIAGTLLASYTLTTITTYQPSYTVFQFLMNTPALELFGTSGAHTVVIT